MRQDAVNMLAEMGITAWMLRDAPPAEVEAEALVQKAADNIAEMGWDTLRYAVSQCEKCGLHRTRTQTVFGTGNQRADWMIIGEAPGQEEDRLGEPFVGPAGKLLNAMLKATGRTREDVYITNIVKCRPPNNRNPHPDEAASCAPYLARQIALLKPKLIIAVGKVAANHLLDVDSNLGRLRGRVHQHPQFDIPIIATYHPAYLLRSPSEKAKAWADLKLAMQTSA